MQALKSLFRRRQVQTAVVAPACQLAELSAESLKLVGGGLPRVSGSTDMPLEPTASALAGAEELPRVS